MNITRRLKITLRIATIGAVLVVAAMVLHYSMADKPPTYTCPQNANLTKATDATNGRPIAEYWDGGCMLADVKPFPLVVIWKDGVVVKRIDERLMIGNIPENKLKNLLAQLDTTGFFTDRKDYVLNHGLECPDGPVRYLSITIGDKQRTLCCDEHFDYEHIGENASPSQKDCVAFVKTWNQAASLLMAIRPKYMKPFRNDRPMCFPGHP